MTSGRPIRDGTRLDVELRLPTVGALFEPPELTPFSPDFHPYSYESGMEYLAYLLYADRRLKAVDATFVVPPDELASTSHEEVSAAIGRYTAAKIEETHIEVRADATRGRRALLIGIGVLVLLLLVARWIDTIGGDRFVPLTLITGLQIGAWVALWFPIQRLFWDAWTHRNDRVVYERLRDTQFTLTTESIGP